MVNLKKRKGYAGIVTQPTPQTQQAHPAQVANSAGGWSFPVSNWERLNRFLILGSETGTYYISERKLTLENMQALQTCLREDGPRVVQTIVEVSVNGRAAKNSPAIFALAVASLPAYAHAETNRAARRALVQVCRTAAMLYEFCEVIQAIGKWNRGLRTAVANWFTAMSTERLAYQLVKYRQRDGWTAKDVLRLAHPQTQDGSKNALLRWAVGQPSGERVVINGNYKRIYTDQGELPLLVQAFETLQKFGKDEAVSAAVHIVDHKLPREAVPTELLNDRHIWLALLQDMPMMALLRNLATMTRVGLLDVTSGDLDAIKTVCTRLTDAEGIRKSRLHPVSILAATKTYAQGRGIRGDKSWLPNPRIIDALNKAFKLAFANVEPYVGRVLIAIDVSTSMYGTAVNGLEYLTAIEGASALALPMLNAMPNAFTCAFNTEHQELTLTAGMSLDQANQAISRKINGGTNCAAPIQWLMKEKRGVDLIVILTDNETWAGGMHPFEALRDYRANVNAQARLATVAMCANGFTLNSPGDAGSLDLVGFDTNTPVILDQFTRGQI